MVSSFSMLKHLSVVTSVVSQGVFTDLVTQPSVSSKSITNSISCPTTRPRLSHGSSRSSPSSCSSAGPLSASYTTTTGHDGFY